MAINEIPTGILPEEIVVALPEVGEENKVYRRLIDPNDELQMTDDFIWYDGEWHDFSFEVKIYGAYFARYQRSVEQVIANFEARIEALEGSSKILFEGNNISLSESMATIGQTINIVSTLEITDGTECKVTLTDMTVDGEAIADVEDNITLYGLADWDWQGADLYSDVFGDGAYFAFGTKPMNAVAEQVTLGFVNENEISHSRTLVIGHIKVEVV